MCGWNPIDTITDIVEDIVDVIVDIVENVISWLIDIPEIPDYGDLNQDAIAKGVLVNKISANATIPIIYGTRKVGGIVSFLETSGTDNQYLYMALVLGEGEINDITSIFVNDNEVTWSGDLADNTQVTVNASDSNYYKAPDPDSSAESLITVEPHFGSDSQTASSLLSTLSSWGSNHRLRGLAYLALRFKWNSDAFGSIPTINAVVKGKKVYNPNLDSTKTGGSGTHREDDSSTWEYSDNPVYQLLDYLRNTRFGMGIANSYFDSNFAEWQTAGDVCDTDITPYSGDLVEQINLMDSNIVVDTSKKAIDNVKEFLKGCRGILNYTAGAYKVLVETTGSAAINLTEDNIIGGIQISSKNKNSRYNRVIVSYINPDKNYQSDEVQFPPVDETGLASADQHSNLLSEDGGILLEGRFDFSMITNPYQAQEMAEIILRRSRSSLDVSITADGTATDLQIGDIVNITHATPSFSAKPFRVQAMSINANSTVQLTLSEHQDSYYTFGTQQEVATIPDTTLPNPFSIQPPASVTLDDSLISYNDGTVIVAMDISIGASTDSFVKEYQVEYKLTSDTNFIVHSKGTVQLNHRVLNVISGENYTVRVKAVNSLGVESTYVTATRDIVGEIAPPSDVEDFAINIVGSDAHLSWKSIPDADLNYYVLNYSSDTVNPEWQNSFPIVTRISRPATSITVPARVGSYLIKAVDKLGNLSSNEAIIKTDIIAIGNFNNVANAVENPDFTGTKSNVVAVDNALELDTIEQFDDNTTDNFDDITTRLFDGGTTNSNVFATGTYEFANIIDLGSAQTTRLTANITQTTDDRDRLFDNVAGLFDDQASNFDGDTSVNAQSHLEIATSDDNVTFSSFRNFNIGDYTARYFKFRLILESLNNAATPVVSVLNVASDMIDRIISGNDIVSSVSGTTITFSPVFKTTPAIGISAQGLATGDFYEITGKSETSFNIVFKNSSNSAISKTFDYLAKGY